MFSLFNFRDSVYFPIVIVKRLSILFILLFTILNFTSCITYDKCYDRFAQQLKPDSVFVYTNNILPEANVEKIFQLDSFFINVHDTVIEHGRVRLVFKTDTIHKVLKIQGNCKADTFTYTKTKIVYQTKFAPLPRDKLSCGKWFKVFGILTFIILFLILIYKIFK